MSCPGCFVPLTESHPTCAIEDVTVRTQTARILDTENFTESLFARLAEYSRAIDEAVGRITTEG